MEKSDLAFQRVYNRIIPVVIGIPVAFLIFFIIVSLVQLHGINARIEEGQSQAITTTMDEMLTRSLTGEQFSKFVILATLEEESLGERYRQGHYTLVSRSFKQFLGFFTGIIMVIVGSVFILLKLKEEVTLDVSQASSWKGSLVTSSPGVAFGVVGAVLISIASLSKDTITISDKGLYLTKEFLVAPYFTNQGLQSKLEEYLLNETAGKSGGLLIVHPPMKDVVPGTGVSGGMKGDSVQSAGNRSNANPPAKPPQ